MNWIKSLLTPPGGERSWTAGVFTLGGFYLLVSHPAKGIQDPLPILWATMATLTGVGLWLRQRWADFALWAVCVPLTDLNDWGYAIEGKESVGLFTVRAIEDIQSS